MYQPIPTKHDQGCPSQLAAAERSKAAFDRTTAGYLYGIAAECAIKALFRENFWTDDSKNGPVYAHFPQLKSKLRDATFIRGAAQLAQFTDLHYIGGMGYRHPL